MAAPFIPNFDAISTYKYSSDDPALRFEVHNPATGKVITSVAGGNASTADAAISAAQQAFETDWRRRAPAERSQLLLKCADAFEAAAPELAAMLCLENGKPYQDALAFDLSLVPRAFRYYGSLIDKLPTEFYDRGQMYVSVLREPHGVCAGILPFNWPPIHAAIKTAPCLAAGNTMVLKPGEQAPLTVLRMVEIANTILPPGVLTAVPGCGIELPQALVSDERVKMIAFTGSSPAGLAVYKSAASKMKHVQLELGGKNAMLVFDDADLDRVARTVIDGAFFNKGEACTASSRLIVQAGVYDELVAKLTAAVPKLRSGDGMKADTHVGPQVNSIQQKKVLEWIETAKREGAQVAAQAALPSDPAYKDGFFVPPTLLTGVTRDMSVAREEIFGPVLTVCKFTTEVEGVSIVNEPRYGLTASVFTKDMERALRLCREFEVGMTFINNYNRNVLGLPFGGVKESGIGREHTFESLKEWTTAKFIQMPSGRGGPVKMWRGSDDVFGSG